MLSIMVFAVGMRECVLKVVKINFCLSWISGL